MIARRLLVRGRVQGVFYRNWTVATARALGVAGWVRNLSSGEVEVYALGEEPAVNALIERCRRGPPAAAVAEVTVSDVEPERVEGFSKRATA
jgi:acylphosphatase